MRSGWVLVALAACGTEHTVTFDLHLSPPCSCDPRDISFAAGVTIGFIAREQQAPLVTSCRTLEASADLSADDLPDLLAGADLALADIPAGRTVTFAIHVARPPSEVACETSPLAQAPIIMTGSSVPTVLDGELAPIGVTFDCVSACP